MLRVKKHVALDAATRLNARLLVLQIDVQLSRHSLGIEALQLVAIFESTTVVLKTHRLDCN